MARPKKDATEKRDKRLTIYLTEGEERRLNAVSEHLLTDKAKLVVLAVNREIDSLAQPPEAMIQTRKASILNSSQEEAVGYICGKGHIFWMDWSWPSPPMSCPCCGDREMARTWSGRVIKGF